MTHKHLNDAQQINTEILQEWLTGTGKQPVASTTLVEVLHDVELSALAGEIEAVKCSAAPCSLKELKLVILHFHFTAHASKFS